MTTPPASVDISETSVRAHSDRYRGAVRSIAGIICGVLAGILLVSSIQNGVSLAVEGHNEGDWTPLIWGEHWAWRAVASIVATASAGFLAGMVARRRGQAIAATSAAPSAIFWLAVAYTGWVGHMPGSIAPTEIPIGYRIVAVVLALAMLPCAGVCGHEGAAYGRANAEHFDGRRGSLLGIRWYHFLWLPVLLHFMVLTAAFGGVYGLQQVIAAMRNAFSLFVIIPIAFYAALFATLGFLRTGALEAYQALAGFDDTSGKSVAHRVLKFGVGYTAATMAAQAAIALVQFGLATLAHKVFG